MMRFFWYGSFSFVYAYEMKYSSWLNIKMQLAHFIMKRKEKKYNIFAFCLSVQIESSSV